MNVKELISFLKKKPQDLPVAYRIYSEQCLLDERDITIEENCVARPDGLVQQKRDDKKCCDYLMFPGN